MRKAVAAARKGGQRGGHVADQQFYALLCLLSQHVAHAEHHDAVHLPHHEVAIGVFLQLCRGKHAM